MPIVCAHATSFDVDVVVFDKDGTLVDLDGLWFPPARGWLDAIAGDDEALGRLLAERLGVDLEGERLVPDGIAAAATFDDFKRTTADELAALLWDAERIAAALSVAGHASNTAMPTEADAVLADIPTLFAELRTAGLRVAVLTSAGRSSTLGFLRQVCADHLVDIVVTATDVDRPKPHPEGLYQIVDALACPAERLLMVGDSVFDHEVARAAGSWFLAVGHQAGAADGADASVECIDQITVG